MRDLSVLIPARNEMFLKNTVEDVLANIRANTEIIVVADGEWPVESLQVNPRVKLLHNPVSRGQRAATNQAAKLSNAQYVMKLDAQAGDAGVEADDVGASAEGADELQRELIAARGPRFFY